MDVKTQRQDARRRAREVRSEQQVARKAREKRLEDLAVRVLVAVDGIAHQERRAGEALRVMVEVEGLSLREAVGWCGEGVSVRTAARFKRLVSAGDEDDAGLGDAAAGNQKVAAPAGLREASQLSVRDGAASGTAAVDQGLA